MFEGEILFSKFPADHNHRVTVDEQLDKYNFTKLTSLVT